MTQKERVEEMLKAGKGYDEIEDQTGSARSYIRSIAVGYRKNKPEEEETGEERRDPIEKIERVERVEETHEKTGMNFLNDESPEKKETGKTGAEHHKEWVKAAKYECGACGATIGRSSGFCPHCGETLVWEGVD